MINFIDLLLLLIILLSAWSGVSRGFIAGMLELFSWLGGLLLTFACYQHLAAFMKDYVLKANAWTVPIAFLITLLLTRIVFALIAERLLREIPPSAHHREVNKITGIIPGAINGLIYAAIVTGLLTLIPFSDNISKQTQESRLANKFSAGIEEAEAKLSPVLGDVDRSFTTVTVKPGTEKFVKLPYQVKNPGMRPDLEAEMLEMVNKERRKAGLNVLKADPDIAKVARKHSQDMFSRGYFSHISPEGATPFDRIREAKIRFLTAGENLALAQTLPQAHEGLMNSPGHKANILHKSFKRLGIGILDGGTYGIMVTQNFRN